MDSSFRKYWTFIIWSYCYVNWLYMIIFILLIVIIMTGWQHARCICRPSKLLTLLRWGSLLSRHISSCASWTACSYCFRRNWTRPSRTRRDRVQNRLGEKHLRLVLSAVWLGLWQPRLHHTFCSTGTSQLAQHGLSVVQNWFRIR